LLTEAQREQERQRVELATAVEQLNEAQAQLTLARQRQDELRQETVVRSAESSGQESESACVREALETAQAENERLTAQLREALKADGTEELKALRKERDALAKKLAAAEAKAASAGESESGSRSKEELQRRFEAAVEEMRELKHANAELEAKLIKARGEGRPSAIGMGGGMDWEAQKQRMLASLEEDDRDGDDAIAEHQSIEGTIRITDQIVSQKDQEIAELKRQLEELAGGAAADASAVAGLLDQDEVIRQEREKLIQVQAEWREKIGKAEIDVSVERAKLARERMELEEKLQAYQREQDDRPSDGTSATQEKPTRGRWLARLGLKDLNDES